MSVLNVYRTYFPDPPGGLQEAIRQICLATRQRNIDNTIFTLSPNPKPGLIERTEAHVIRRRSWAAPASCDLGGLGAVREFRHLAREADMVHYFFPWPFADVLCGMACSDKPVVLTYISDIVRQRWLGAAYAPIMWRTLRSVDAIVANCPAYVETSPVLSNPLIRDKVSVIPLGIVEESYPKMGNMEIFTRLNIAPDEPFFLFIGVLRYYKGVHTLIKAAKGLKVKIIVAGSGPENERLRGLADDLGVVNIIFAGQITDHEKVALLKRCRALVLPSHLRSEAYGMVLVEASMFGRPLISCEIGTGTSFINQHEKTGFVVPPETPKQLAQAMSLLLSDDRLVDLFGRAARHRYEALFSGPALGGAYAQLYRRVLEK